MSVRTQIVDLLEGAAAGEDSHKIRTGLGAATDQVEAKLQEIVREGTTPLGAFDAMADAAILLAAAKLSTAYALAEEHHRLAEERAAFVAMVATASKLAAAIRLPEVSESPS